MSLDFSGYSALVTGVVLALASNVPLVVGSALGIFGGILLFSVGVRWARRMLGYGGNDYDDSRGGVVLTYRDE